MVELDKFESERGPVVHTEPAPDHLVTGDDQMATSKSSKSPAFQFYPKDFLSSSKVGRMSLTERGAYITLLSHCWLDGSLPADAVVLARIVGMKAKQFTRMWTSGPLHECFVEKAGRLTNARLDHERKVQSEFRRRQSDNGKLGGRPKKAVGSSGLTQPEAKESSPIPNPQSAIPNLQPAVVGRAQPIQARRRMDAAFEGPRVYVPQRVHADFLAFRSGNADELFKWYEAVSEDWSSGSRRGSETGADMIQFWKARYAEKWPAEAPPALHHGRPRPAWASK